MKKLIFIKLGGSLVSDKTKINKARLEVIENLSRQIKEILEKDKNLSLVIATGAGGFGHPVAQKYKDNLEKGLPFIKKAVKKLNQIVVFSLNKKGVKAISVEPSKISEYKNGQMVRLLHGYIVSLLDKNIVPVFHADLVKDKTKGLSILSMDKFLVELAIWFNNQGFKVSKIIFAGMTPGVVDRFGKTVKKITKDSYYKIKPVFYQGKGVDVTGGMRYKVEQCLRLVDYKINGLIINGLDKNSGTVITK